MTFEEIVEILNTKLESKHDFKYLYDSITGLVGKVNLVASYGGEGKGEEYYTVQHFVDHDIYIRLDGFYTSYSRVDFDGYDYTQVTPNEKTITVYE